MTETIANGNSHTTTGYNGQFTESGTVAHHGLIIDQIKSYANTSIKEEESMSVRCSTFNDFDVVCMFIAANENIASSRIYPALRLIGYNDRYHQFKLTGSDLIEDRSSLIQRSILSMNDGIINIVADHKDIFRETTKKVHRINRNAVAIANKTSDRCRIRVSDLNLYHALCGLRMLVDIEPDYILLQDKERFVASMAKLNRFEAITKAENTVLAKVLR